MMGSLLYVFSSGSGMLRSCSVEDADGSFSVLSGSLDQIGSIQYGIFLDGGVSGLGGS